MLLKLFMHLLKMSPPSFKDVSVMALQCLNTNQPEWPTIIPLKRRESHIKQMYTVATNLEADHIGKGVVETSALKI